MVESFSLDEIKSHESDRTPHSPSEIGIGSDYILESAKEIYSLKLNMIDKLKNNIIFYSLWAITIVVSNFIYFYILYSTYGSFLFDGIIWSILVVLLILIPALIFSKLWMKIIFTLVGYIVVTLIFIGPLFRILELEIIAFGFVIIFSLLFSILFILIEHFILNKTLVTFFVIFLSLAIWFAISLFNLLSSQQHREDQANILYNIRRGRYESVDEAIRLCESISDNNLARNTCFYYLAVNQRFMRQDLCDRFVDSEDYGTGYRTKQEWTELCATSILKK